MNEVNKSSYLFALAENDWWEVRKCVCMCVEGEVIMHLQGKNRTTKRVKPPKHQQTSPNPWTKVSQLEHFKLVFDILILTAADVHGAFQHMTSFREVAGYWWMLGLFGIEA